MKEMRVVERALSINPSPTLVIDAKAKQLMADGQDVVSFGAGEPDFDTPVAIKAAAITALEKGQTKYTAAAGTLPLKKAVCTKMERDHGLRYQPEQVIICCGAKHALYNLFQVICQPGDQVLLPAPYWVSYPEQIKLAGAQPQILMTAAKNHFKITPEQLRQAITPQTVALVLNSPANPTGSVYTAAELQAIAQIAVENQLIVISDEIYEKLIYTGEHVSIASLNPQIKDLTIIINGVSKTFAMTGWRIGYAVGNQEVIAAMSRLQSHSTSNATTFCQAASLLALTNPPETVFQKMLAEFKKRRDYMVATVNSIPGLSCHEPSGAFYVFINLEHLIGRQVAGRVIGDGTDFAELLLETSKVAVVPGTAFGMPQFLRLSYAISMEDIERGLARIAAFVRGISG